MVAADGVENGCHAASVGDLQARRVEGQQEGEERFFVEGSRDVEDCGAVVVGELVREEFWVCVVEKGQEV